MKVNKEEIKEVWFYQRRVTILFLIIITAFFWSCDSNDNLPSPPNDPQDTTVVNGPIIQTPSPVIYLTDNLDEQDQLGYLY